MNKIHTINLGGNPFTVDEDALEYLQAYIRSLKKHFKNSPGCEEIISDIESRLAELLTERMEGKQIVTLREVKEVISIMGSPEEFGAEPIDEKIIDPNRKRKDHTGRRLFRDPDDKIVSGVCSGIAAYFGIQDPVWVRLAFGLMMFGGGVTIPLYIILRIIMPKADSAADRLAMKGEPIDYKSIAKTIQDEISHLSHEFNTMDMSGDTMHKQWDATKSFADKGFHAGSNVLGNILRTVMGIIGSIVPVLLKIFAVFAIIIMSMMFIGLIFGWSMLWPFAPHVVAGGKVVSALSMMNLFFIGLIPLVFGLFFVARLYNGTRLPKAIAAGLGGLWILNLLSGSAIGINTARQFNNHAEVNRTIYEGNINSDLLRLELGETKERGDFTPVMGPIWMEDGKIIHSEVRIRLQESADDQFHIVQNNIANGESTNQAKANAQNLGSIARIEGNSLFVNNFIELDKRDKMRNQHSYIIISVPIGKKVKVSDQMWNVDGPRDESQGDVWEMGGKTWTMTKKGLICPEIDVKNNKTGDVEEVRQLIGEAVEVAKEAVQDVKESIKEVKATADETKESVKEVKERVKQIKDEKN